jgi:hypothetical protein
MPRMDHYSVRSRGGCRPVGRCIRSHPGARGPHRHVLEGTMTPKVYWTLGEHEAEAQGRISQAMRWFLTKVRQISGEVGRPGQGRQVLLEHLARVRSPRQQCGVSLSRSASRRRRARASAAGSRGRKRLVQPFVFSTPPFCHGLIWDLTSSCSRMAVIRHARPTNKAASPGCWDCWSAGRASWRPARAAEPALGPAQR